ncbi:hypothetical protein K1719_015351 [Acacia pycnantha]|nr:hypothetical protein K1719_015351 [Acacia pycnantha]
MFRHQKKYFVIMLTIIVFATRAENSNSCERRCGGYTIQYPFGFSEDCEIKLNCSSSDGMEIGGLRVNKVTTSSIFIDVPWKCNRSVQAIRSLFSNNFAPTRNNSFILQAGSSTLGCGVPATSLVDNQTELEDCNKEGHIISFFTVVHRKNNDSDVVSYEDVLELGWWLQYPCPCHRDAKCNKVHLADGKLGFRCHCPGNYVGDGYQNGTGCRICATDDYYCAHLTSKLGKVGGGISAALFLGLLAWFLYDIILRHLRKRAEQLLREVLGNSSLVVYPYNEIEAATNFFSDQRKLGSGAFGTVYLGKLHNQWVAIKKIKSRDNNNVVRVINEIKLLSLVSHPNLVRILGCWIGETKQIIVFEFVPNGTLSQHLQRQRSNVLPWITRLTVASETANAIAYLHSAIDPPIYHRDIKSSNILLDYDFKSKVADFGLSRLGIADISHISTGPRGTPGYVDPSYEHNFHLSDKSDVYSFGVVLVEIITALKVVDFSRPKNEVNLAALAVDRIGRGCVEEIVDPLLSSHEDEWTNYSVHKVAELAFRCLDSRRDIRPAMMEVAEELEYIKSSGCNKMEETTCTTSPGASHIHENLRTQTLTVPADG